MSARVLVDDSMSARAGLRPLRRVCSHPGCDARGQYKSDLDEDLCGTHFRALRAESEARVLTPTEPRRVGVEQGQEGEVTSRSSAPTVPSSAQPTPLVTAQDVEDPQRVAAQAGSAPIVAVEDGVALVAEATVTPGDQAPQELEGADIEAPPPRSPPVTTSGGKMKATTCAIEGCRGPGSSRGMCARHYQAGIRQAARDRKVRKGDLDPTLVTDADLKAATVRWIEAQAPLEPVVMLSNEEIEERIVAIAEEEERIALPNAFDRAQLRAERKQLQRIADEMATIEPPRISIALTADELDRRHDALLNARLLRGSEVQILGLPSFALERVQAAAKACIDAQIAYWEGIALRGDPS